MSTSPRHSWGSTDDGQIVFESLTTETLEGALDVMRKSFLVRESGCVGVDILSEPGAAEEFLDLCVESAKDGVSAVAIEKNTKKVVGAAFAKIQVRGEKNCFEWYSGKCKRQSSKAFMDFMDNMDKRMNLFKKYDVDCILELIFLGVLPDYGQRRIGELLTSTLLQIGIELYHGNNVKVPVMVRGTNELTNANMVPPLISATMTSKFSQRISAKLGFKELLRASFEEFEFAGKKFSERITSNHIDCTLTVKVLKPM